MLYKHTYTATRPLAHRDNGFIEAPAWPIYGQRKEHFHLTTTDRNVLTMTMAMTVENVSVPKGINKATEGIKTATGGTFRSAPIAPNGIGAERSRDAGRRMDYLCL